jgi:hypothetical protein
MFNVRPDTPWIYLNPEPVDDDPPGFRLSPDGSAMDARQRSSGFGSFTHGPGIFGAPGVSTAYDASYFPFQTPTEHPFQGAFDQLARIYADAGSLRRQAAGFGLAPADSGARSQGGPVLPELGNPWPMPLGSMSDSRFMPLSYGSSSIQTPIGQFAGDSKPSATATTSLAPRNPLPDSRPLPMAGAVPAAPWQPNAEGGEVLSDAGSEDGLRDGQQYAEVRRPLPMRGVRVGVDEEGHDVLVQDGSGEPDPFERLRQKGYPQPPQDPSNGSTMVKELREREQYGRHHGGYHRYEFTDHLCDLGDPGCNADAAYEALLRHAVPGGPASGVSVEHGQEAPVSLMGVPGGHIRTLVDHDSRSIINQTLSDHQFHNGFVQRQIVEKDGKIYVRTFGEGNNITPDKAGWNRLLAEPAFEESTARIRAALRPAAPIGKQ